MQSGNVIYDRQSRGGHATVEDLLMKEVWASGDTPVACGLSASFMFFISGLDREHFIRKRWEDIFHVNLEDR